MKKNEHVIFATNLQKCRQALGWSQTKAAVMLGIKRATYAAYEERRSLPPVTFLPHLARTMGITFMAGFLENPDFSYEEQEKEFLVTCESEIETRYLAAAEHERMAVDKILGIG